MNAELQQLKDIHLPKVIHNWWPLAPGWIGLLVVLLATMCSLIYFWYKRRQKKYTVKFALAKLDKLQQLLIENPEKINIAAEISTLLRRTALYYFSREEIAALSGKHWLHFLNQSGEMTDFTQDIGRLLTDVPYQKDSKADLTSLFACTRAWLNALLKKNMIAAEK